MEMTDSPAGLGADVFNSGHWFDTARMLLERVPIPNADQAVIEPEKLYGYLLAPSHPIGRFKAAFFLTLGYTSDNWRRLDADLRSQHLSQESTLEASAMYGQKYTIRARLEGPSGASADTVSVWVVRTGEEFPRFVTAYPEGNR